MPYKDKEVRAEYMQRYAKQHRTELNEYSSEYHKNNARALRSRWGMFLWQAKDRGHEVGLTFEEWCTLIKDAACHYCQKQLTMKGGSGLDRKDSSHGYIKDNVVPCCPSCNRMKNNILTYEEMMFIMPLLLEFRKKGVN